MSRNDMFVKLPLLSLTNVLLLSFIVMPFKVVGAETVSDSARIGIKLVIKASPQCDYVLDKSSTSNQSNNLYSTSCDISYTALEQSLNHVVNSAAVTKVLIETKATAMDQINLKRYRVFMTVQ